MPPNVEIDPVLRAISLRDLKTATLNFLDWTAVLNGMALQPTAGLFTDSSFVYVGNLAAIRSMLQVLAQARKRAVANFFGFQFLLNYDAVFNRKVEGNTEKRFVCIKSWISAQQNL